MTKAKKYLGRFNHDESKILNCIVTVMKYGFIMLNLTKSSVKAVETSCSPPPKKSKLYHLLERLCKLLLTDSLGLILALVMPKGRTVTAGSYLLDTS